MEYERKLNDEDVKALVDEIESRFEKRFYLNIGHGVWSIAWRLAIACVLFVAAYGSYKGDHFF